MTSIDGQSELLSQLEDLSPAPKDEEDDELDTNSSLDNISSSDDIPTSFNELETATILDETVSQNLTTEMLLEASRSRAARLALVNNTVSDPVPPVEDVVPSSATTDKNSRKLALRKRYQERAIRWGWAEVKADDALIAGYIVGKPEIVPIEIGNSILHEVRVMVNCAKKRVFGVSGIIATNTVGTVSVTCGPGVGMESLDEGTFCQFVGSLRGSPLRLDVRLWRNIPSERGEMENYLVLTGVLSTLGRGHRSAAQEATISSVNGSNIRVVLPEGHIVAPGTPVVAVGRPLYSKHPLKSILYLTSIRLDEHQFGQ